MSGAGLALPFKSVSRAWESPRMLGCEQEWPLVAPAEQLLLDASPRSQYHSGQRLDWSNVFALQAQRELEV